MSEKDVNKVPEDLFKNVTFYIVGDITENVIELLTKYGGKRDTYLSEMVSHVIADDVDHHEYQEARELFELPCVMSEWVLYSVKCGKMLDKDLFAPEGRLFSGIVACASKLEEKDWLNLWGMIVVNGGRCQGNLTSRCTHLLTADMEGAKYLEALTHDTIRIVTPDWVTDSVEKEEKQEEDVYHPRLVVYPKPPSPPKPEPPKPAEPMEVTVPTGSEGLRQQVPQGLLERHLSTEEAQMGSRPGTPGSASTKEALAKLVNNRMQEPMPRTSQMGAPGPYPPMHGHHPGMRPGMHPGHPPGQHGYPSAQHAGQHMGQHPGFHPGQQRPGQHPGYHAAHHQGQHPGHMPGHHPGQHPAQQGQQTGQHPGRLPGHLQGHHPRQQGQLPGQHQGLHPGQHPGYMQGHHPGQHPMPQGHHPGQQQGHHPGQQGRHPGQPGLHPGQQSPGQQSHHPGQSLHHSPQQSPHPGQPGHHPGQPGHHPGQPGHHPGQQGPHPGQPGHHPGKPGHHPGQQGHHPSQQGHHPGPPGHHPGPQGHPSQQGHHPGQPSHLTSPPGHHPNQQGHSPVQQGHHPGQQGHHPGQQGHHPGPQGHHPGKPGHHPGKPGHHPGQQPGQQQRPQLPGVGLQQASPTAQPKLRNITNIENQKQQQGKQQQQQQQKLGFPAGGSTVQRPPPPQYFNQQSPTGFPGPQQSWPLYWGHDPADNVPSDLCLLGCIFYINDYPKIVGLEQIALWKKVIEQHGGQVDPSYSNRVTHVMCASQKTDVFLLALRDQRRIVTAFWLNDVLSKKKMSPPWQALHVPLLYSDDSKKPCSNQIISITNFDGDDRIRVKQMIQALGAKYTGYMTRTNSALVCRGPDGVKYQKAKEWQIPVMNVEWLSDLLLGHMDALRLPIDIKYLQINKGDEFQMDLNRVQPLMAAWRTPLKVSKEIWKRFSPNLKKGVPAPGQENIHASPNKKARMDPSSMKGVPDLSTPGPRVLFTGFIKVETKQLTTMITQLGGTVVENPLYCTHLVAASFSRTMKFFVAINVVHHIVTKHWVEQSHQQHSFLDENLFLLQDPVGEAEIKCPLQQSLARAHTQKLFAGMTFFITPSVQPPACDLKKIIESAGGTLAKKKRLASKTIASLVDDQGHPSYVVITCQDDIHLCDDLIEKKIKVFTAEFVLTGVLRQEKNFQQFQIEIQR